MPNSNTSPSIGERIRLYFLGSGAIAAPSLAALWRDERFDLLGCGTQPDRPQGRRRRSAPTAVGAFCRENSIDARKPASVNDADFVDFLRTLHLDLLVVFAFGQILGGKVLALPRFGCVNIHASLLPRHRGAAPVSAAILGGDEATGVSIMRMTKGLDTGPVYRQHQLRLDGNEGAASLEGRLAELAAAQIGDAVFQIVREDLQPSAQDSSRATYAPRLEKRDGEIDWQASAAHVERLVRAYSPWPGAWCSLATGKGLRKITITAATVGPGVPGLKPGQIVQADKNGWRVACGDGTLNIEKIIPEGTREMTGTAFLLGFPLTAGSSMGNHETDHCKQREPANTCGPGT